MEWLPTTRAQVCLAAEVVQGLLLASGTALFREILQAEACRNLSVCTCNELSLSSSAELKDERILA